MLLPYEHFWSFGPGVAYSISFSWPGKFLNSCYYCRSSAGLSFYLLFGSLMGSSQIVAVSLSCEVLYLFIFYFDGSFMVQLELMSFSALCGVLFPLFHGNSLIFSMHLQTLLCTQQKVGKWGDDALFICVRLGFL